MENLNPPVRTPPENAPGATASLVFGILGLTVLPVIGAVTGIVLAHRAMAKIARSGNGLGGQGMAMGGLITGYIGLVFALVMALVVAMLVPAIGQARTRAREARSMADVRQILVAALYSAEENNLQLPADLDTLKNGNRMFVGNASMWTSPNGADYVLIARGKTTDPHNRDSARAVLVVEVSPSPAGNYAVGFLNGHAEKKQVSEIAPEELIKQQTPPVAAPD